MAPEKVYYLCSDPRHKCGGKAGEITGLCRWDPHAEGEKVICYLVSIAARTHAFAVRDRALYQILTEKEFAERGE